MYSFSNVFGSIMAKTTRAFTFVTKRLLFFFLRYDYSRRTFIAVTLLLLPTYLSLKTASFLFSRSNFLNPFLSRQSTFIPGLTLGIFSRSFHSVFTTTVSFSPFLVTWSNRWMVWPLTWLVIIAASSVGPFRCISSVSSPSSHRRYSSTCFLLILLPTYVRLNVGHRPNYGTVRARVSLIIAERQFFKNRSVTTVKPRRQPRCKCNTDGFVGPWVGTF